MLKHSPTQTLIHYEKMKWFVVMTKMIHWLKLWFNEQQRSKWLTDSNIDSLNDRGVNRDNDQNDSLNNRVNDSLTQTMTLGTRKKEISALSRWFPESVIRWKSQLRLKSYESWIACEVELLILRQLPKIYFVLFIRRKGLLLMLNVLQQTPMNYK